MSKQKACGWLPGTFRTVVLTRCLRRSGIERFVVGKSCADFEVTKRTLLSRLLRRPPADIPKTLSKTLPALPDRDLSDTIRVSLIAAFDQNPEAERMEVDTGKLSWKVIS